MSSYGRYFNDFVEGELIKHPLSKTIFESDNNLFSLLTMNHHPVHLNQEFAKATQHGKILVVGTLVFSIAVGITVGDISGNAIANLEYNNVIHLKPVFIGDTITVTTQIINVRPSRTKLDRGVIHVKSIVTNQHEMEVLTFGRKVLIRKKI